MPGRRAKEAAKLPIARAVGATVGAHLQRKGKGTTDYDVENDPLAGKTSSPLAFIPIRAQDPSVVFPPFRRSSTVVLVFEPTASNDDSLPKQSHPFSGTFAVEP